MHATEKRLSFALLFAAGVISFNVYLVLTGAAGDLYDQLSGSAPLCIVWAKVIRTPSNSRAFILRVGSRSNVWIIMTKPIT